jgi:Na+/proline symporter
VGLGDALHIAGATGRLRTFDFTFSLTDQYTFWSGTIAALFLFASYFGTDQSQVQRYLAAKSLDQARSSLMMSAYWKIPLQALVLLVGVLLFVFYLFTPPPMLFNRVHEDEVRAGSGAVAYASLEEQFAGLVTVRREQAGAVADARRAGDAAAVARAEGEFRASESELKRIRAEAATLVRRETGDARYNDVNYVFPTFVLTHLPTGLVGLILAAIFAAAMSSIAAELNALSTATVMDFYRRYFCKEAPDAHYLTVSRVATAAWGGFTCVVAIWAAELGSLIEVVNRFGSFFYGSILGVFLLAILWKRATGHGAFLGLIGGMAAVGYVASSTNVAFLWLNVVGAVAVFVIGIVVSAAVPGRQESGQAR